MILQINQISCKFQELRPSTCIQLESLADEAFDPLHPFMEEMLTENCTDISWNPDDYPYGREDFCGPGYHGYCILHEGDLKMCRDYYCSDPDRYDDRVSYPIEDHFMRTGNWIGPVNSTVDYWLTMNLNLFPFPSFSCKIKSTCVTDIIPTSSQS